MASCSIPSMLIGVESTTNPDANILQRLDAFEILMSARNVCPYWWNICKDPCMWRSICMIDIHMLRYDYSVLSKIFRYAVDQSRGCLEEIYIKYFGTNVLLKYVADRASQLRRLRIAECHRSMSSEGLIEALKKLPLLEELDISNCRLLNTDSFDAINIGQSCPLLKSLNLKFLFDRLYACDRQAFGIAETMPGLHHLKILNNNLTKDGLLAILDGCPLLESLDLRGCFHLDLRGSIGNRCIMEIRVLWLPTEFIDESDEICEDPYLLSLLLCWPGYDFMRLDAFDDFY